jgi:hypothetical protein
MRGSRKSHIIAAGVDVADSGAEKVAIAVVIVVVAVEVDHEEEIEAVVPEAMATDVAADVVIRHVNPTFTANLYFTSVETLVEVLDTTDFPRNNKTELNSRSVVICTDWIYLC